MCILSKIRLADIIEVKPRQCDFMKYFNKINKKHIDFVICDKQTLKPLVFIELDDNSHQKQERIERDIFVDKAMFACGHTVIHLKNSSETQIQIIIDKVKSFNKAEA